jgi:hypothetical protein
MYIHPYCPPLWFIALYETTPKWHGFLMIKLAAFQASSAARMKLHEIQRHFREVPHAVTEYGLRRRPRRRPRPSSPIKF